MFVGSGFEGLNICETTNIKLHVKFEILNFDHNWTCFLYLIKSLVFKNHVLLSFQYSVSGSYWITVYHTGNKIFVSVIIINKILNYAKPYCFFFWITLTNVILRVIIWENCIVVYLSVRELVFVLTQENTYLHRVHFRANRKNIIFSKQLY